MGVNGEWAVGVLCKILWVKLIEGGYRNEWQFLRGNSVRPAKCQGNAVGRAFWNLWTGSAQDRPFTALAESGAVEGSRLVS